MTSLSIDVAKDETVVGSGVLERSVLKSVSGRIYHKRKVNVLLACTNCRAVKANTTAHCIRDPSLVANQVKSVSR